MADSDLRNLINQIRNLSDEQLEALQSHVDVAEQRARSSHHDTTSHHHTSALLEFDVPQIREREG
jgi:di/tripeptidase